MAKYLLYVAASDKYPRISRDGRNSEFLFNSHTNCVGVLFYTFDQSRSKGGSFAKVILDRLGRNFGFHFAAINIDAHRNRTCIEIIRNFFKNEMCHG